MNSLTTMNDLFLNSLIFSSLLLSLDTNHFVVFSFIWNLVDKLISIGMWNVFSLVFNCIVVSKPFFVWNGFGFLLSNIFDMTSFIWDIFDSRFTFDVWLLGNGGSFVLCVWCRW